MNSTRLDHADHATIASYYDIFFERCLTDYIFGNDRIAAGINRATSVVMPGTSTLLDVGCGIGITSATLAERFPHLTVHGVDISPRRIASAQSLFAKENLLFDVSDMRDTPRYAPYDVVTMFDVYEHIPRNARCEFNAVLARSLGPNGTLVVTTPTELHQRHLAQHKPTALQIVDEMVRLEDLAELARDVGGTVVRYEFVSIWNSHDYCHTVIHRNPGYQPLTWTRQDRTLWWRAANWFSQKRIKRKALRDVEKRRIHVKSTLGVRM